MEQFNLLNHIVNNDNNIVVWLYNIGVEKYWTNEISLVKDKYENIIVNHMEEMNLLLTRKQDIMILRRYPDNIFIKELEKLSFEIPHILIPQTEDEEKSISELVLDDIQLLEELKSLSSKNQNIYFVPYGISWLEEKIANICGLKLYGAASDIQKLINNKIYSRSIAKYLGYKTTDGYICKDINEVRTSYTALKKKYDKIIIKTPSGASGKGMWIIESEKNLYSVCLILKRLQRLNEEYIVEGWEEKKSDLNYQVYVSEDGYTEVFSIKEQIVNETVYVGSVLPARVTNEILDTCKKCGEEIGALLYRQGFYGILGIDALLTSNNELIPILEINGRFTLSTYVSFLSVRYKNKIIISLYNKFRSKNIIDYNIIVGILKKENLWLSKNGKGVYIYAAKCLDSTLAYGNCRAFYVIIDEESLEIKNTYEKMKISLKQAIEGESDEKENNKNFK